jgi:hypothetical protein
MDPPPGPVVQTNPIPGDAGWGGATGAWDVGKMRETNPILQLRIGDCRASLAMTCCGLGTALRRNAGPLACRFGLTRANCAKRTQFSPAWAGPGLRRAKDAKRTQFRATPDGTGPQGRGTWEKCAKRTQFRGADRGPEAQMRKTKPNLGRIGHLGGRISEANRAKQDAPDKSRDRPNQSSISAQKGGSKPEWGTFVVGVKQSQFSRWKRSGGDAQPTKSRGAIVRHHLDAPLRETNPIWAWLGRGQTPGGRKMRNKPNSRDKARGTRGDCAKRSQTWAGWDIWGWCPKEVNRARQTQFAGGSTERSFGRNR